MIVTGIFGLNKNKIKFNRVWLIDWLRYKIFKIRNEHVLIDIRIIILYRGKNQRRHIILLFHRSPFYCFLNFETNFFFFFFFCNHVSKSKCSKTILNHKVKKYICISLFIIFILMIFFFCRNSVSHNLHEQCPICESPRFIKRGNSVSPQPDFHCLKLIKLSIQSNKYKESIFVMILIFFFFFTKFCLRSWNCNKDLEITA